MSTTQDVLVCHPDLYEAVMAMAEKQLAAQYPFDIHRGMRFTTSPYVPKYPRKWVFPKERFVEYEKSDEAWAIPLGFGHWEDDTTKPVIWKIQHNCFANPFFGGGAFHSGVTA